MGGRSSSNSSAHQNVVVVAVQSADGDYSPWVVEQRWPCEFAAAMVGLMERCLCDILGFG